ncbi:DUF4215 domain-containing protein [Patescibacteria group bacterium]|nr:DUF4215 domain-containing protein [Patescibacteria group bacterium]MBU4078278.1 DUF4215 domain-containing protein [Patescibacteria group bacterium]MBU4162277.1 DUF4215 domain-containing protein [Patescibacteria group bacterium]
MKTKSNLIILFFVAVFSIFILFSTTRVYAGNPFPPDDVIVSADTVFLGDSSQIQVTVKAYPLAYAWKIKVDFGDGSGIRTRVCFIDSILGQCTLNFPHPYGTIGSYAVKVNVCDKQNITLCRTGRATAVVNGPFVCGNNTLEPPGEECDDGNTVSGDGCSQSCKIEHPSPPPVNNDLNPLQANTFGELFRDIVGAIFWIAIILGPLLIIAGGFMIIFAGLDGGKIILGKKIILYTAVILGIILIIKAMADFFAPDVTFL